MTLVRIDPTEMEAGSAALQAAATTVAGVGTGLRGLCAVPGLAPAVGAQVAATAAALERTFHEVHVELLLHGLGLAVRGLLAATDATSVTSGSMAVGPVGAMSAVVSSAAVIGGTGGADFTITGPDGTPVDTSELYAMGGTVGGATTGVVGTSPLYGSSAVIGGNGGEDITFTDASGAPVSRDLLYPSAAVIGPATNPTMADLPPEVFAIVSGANERMIDVALDPSRSSLSFAEGRPISPTEYTDRGYRGLND